MFTLQHQCPATAVSTRKATVAAVSNRIVRPRFAARRIGVQSVCIAQVWRPSVLGNPVAAHSPLQLVRVVVIIVSKWCVAAAAQHHMCGVGVLTTYLLLRW